jgi:hypothetical protein
MINMRRNKLISKESGIIIDLNRGRSQEICINKNHMQCWIRSEENGCKLLINQLHFIKVIQIVNYRFLGWINAVN